jgi:hypothetical protein
MPQRVKERQSLDHISNLIEPRDKNGFRIIDGLTEF